MCAQKQQKPKKERVKKEFMELEEGKKWKNDGQMIQCLGPGRRLRLKHFICKPNDLSSDHWELCKKKARCSSTHLKFQGSQGQI